MKFANIHQPTRKFTIILAGLLCVLIITAQTVRAGQHDPQPKPKPPSNVDPLGILNTPEPPKPTPPAGQKPATNKPTPTPQSPKSPTYSSSLDTVLSSNGIVASWVPGNGAAIPPNAVVAGNENGSPLYACRFRDKKNWVMLGKVVGEGCNYGLGKENVSKQFEVLVGGGSWRQPTSSFAGALDAGPDYDGSPRYLCRAPYQGGVHPGRLLNSGCYISYSGKAFSVTEYEVFYSSAGTLASNGASNTPANQRSSVTPSSLDSTLGGSAAAMPVTIAHISTQLFLRNGSQKYSWFQSFDKNSIFHLTDLNGGQLESGDYVTLRHQPTGQFISVVQGKNGPELAMGMQNAGEPAKFKLVKLQLQKDQGIEAKGVISKQEAIALQPAEGQYLKCTKWTQSLKIEAANKFGNDEVFQLNIFDDDAHAIASAEAWMEHTAQAAAALEQKVQARQARNDAIFNRIEQVKTDARNEQIQQAEDAQRVKAEQEAAREEAAKQAEAQRQLDNFRNAEAEAKRQRDEQAAQEAERQRQAALAVAPKLLSPAPNGVVSNGCYNFAYVTRTYSWTAVSLATTYQLYVKSPRATGPNLDVQVAGTSYTEKSNSYAPESARFGITWKVRGMINGQWGAWSEERTFEYEQVNTNPACRQ